MKELFGGALKVAVRVVVLVGVKDFLLVGVTVGVVRT